VFEISVVTVPANQNAVATEVKSIDPETKQGKRNSKKDKDTINQIINLAKSLLDDEGEDTQEEPKANEEPTEETNAAAEESKTAENSEKAKAFLETIKNYKGGC